jgi:AraC-like DNA-binding protein
MSAPVPDGTVLATLPRMILGYLGVGGFDAQALAAEAGLAGMGWDDADERVPRASVDALWNLAVRETKDGGFGLRLFAALPAGNTGVMEVVVQSAPTVDVALKHLCRYWTLINDAVELRIHRSAGRYGLVLVTRNGVPLARPWIDLTAIALVTRAMSAVQQAQAPTEVVLPYPRDRFCEELEAALGAPVRYGGPHLEISFRPEVATLPLTTSSPALHNVVAAHAEAALGRLLRERSDPATPDLDALIAEVRAAILARLESGDVSLPDVADAVGLSARTLQRRLADAGTSLREVVDAARQQQALEELARPDVSITEVAFLLGFSETSAFDRAFRRWTGKAPAEFRAARSVN